MKQSEQVCEFRRDAAYTLGWLAERGFGKAAIQSARRRGLVARKLGRSTIVLGSDLLDYLERHAATV